MCFTMFHGDVPCAVRYVAMRCIADVTPIGRCDTSCVFSMQLNSQHAEDPSLIPNPRNMSIFSACNFLCRSFQGLRSITPRKQKRVHNMNPAVQWIVLLSAWPDCAKHVADRRRRAYHRQRESAACKDTVASVKQPEQEATGRGFREGWVSTCKGWERWIEMGEHRPRTPNALGARRRGDLAHHVSAAARQSNKTPREEEVP